MTNLDVTDPTFCDDLDYSDEAVRHIALWLREKYKLTVVLPPVIKRDRVENRADYADNGDLFIMRCVQVKRRPSIDFRSAADFPHPTVIVDFKYNYDRMTPKPQAYYICNASLTGALVVLPRETRRSWVVESRYDSRIKREREYYECPVHLAQYEDVRLSFR